jgi:5-methyltetrahydropteroyltriglutamate--homocysteine methyltransferase
MKHVPIITVIGSYPYDMQNTMLMQTYWDQQIIPSWQPHISEVVNDMVRAGVQLVSDGQTRDPFITIFARGLQGCRIRDRPEVVDKIRYVKPITLSDLKYVRTILPKTTRLLGLLVGPHTFSETVFDSYYNDKEKMAFDAAEALHKEACCIAPFVDMISVDEPHFSTSFPTYASELIDIVVDGINLPLRLHVCGDVSSIVPELLDMPVDVLSHEFKATPTIFDAYEQYPDNNKRFCIGCVRSDNERIESVSDISQHIEKAINVFGNSIEQLSPDCGLRLLHRTVAFEKLRNLTTALEKMMYG